MNKHNLLVALAASVVTVIVTVIVLNLRVGEKQIDRRIERLYSASDPQFRRSLSVLLGPPILEGNQVETLLNGDQIFPAMLTAIRGAQRSITFETYIYWSGSIGAEFVEALSERARAGVKVHLMLDYMGSMKMDSTSINRMRAVGVEVQRYHRPVWYHLARLNNRTHRKTLVVDGEIGFTGGVGIADKWSGNAQGPDHWRDTHFRITGPAVAQIQSVFTDNWIKSTGRVLHGERYFPALAPAGDMSAQMFSSSPTGGSESMHLMYLLAITSAERRIDLANSYFVPDSLAVQALADAARRGVQVRIIVPGKHIDTEIVRGASRGLWGPLLEAGVQIAEYQPTMFHVKSLVVDSRMVSVGSTNFDNRSFSINDEANLNVLDERFAAEQERIFEADWAKARPMTLAQWRARPWSDRMKEKIAGLLRAQLERGRRLATLQSEHRTDLPPGRVPPMMPTTSYDTIDDFGMLYDQVPAYAARADVGFYLSEAGEGSASVGPIIELGCGTGRVLLPLARAGHRVTGVDSSSHMLARLRQHLANEPVDVQARVQVHQADVREFAVTPPVVHQHAAGFGLAIAPFRTLQHLTSPADQLRCLTTIRHHLRPGGRLVFDVFNPDYPLMSSDRSVETDETPELQLVDGRFMRRSVRVTAVHWREQTSDIELIYHIRAVDGAETRGVQSFPMRWYGPAELEHLLARAGFRVTVMYGNFDRSTLRDDSPEIIVVAERDG